MDADSEGLTRWRMIGDALAADIENGVLPPDTRLPPSAELARSYGVNRHTVLRAISYLKERGIVRVERGRGTFAVVNPLQYQLGPRRWFEQNLLENNLRPARTVLDVRRLAATSPIAEELGVENGAPLVCVSILGTADDVPVNYNHHYFSQERLPDIEAAFRAFEGETTESLSFSQIFREQGITDWRRERIRIRSRAATEEEARHLKAASNEQLLETLVLSVDADGAPLVYAATCFCSSRVELVLDV